MSAMPHGHVKRRARGKRCRLFPDNRLLFTRSHDKRGLVSSRYGLPNGWQHPRRPLEAPDLKNQRMCAMLRTMLSYLIGIYKGVDQEDVTESWQYKLTSALLTTFKQSVSSDLQLACSELTTLHELDQTCVHGFLKVMITTVVT